MNAEKFLANFGHIANAPGGVKSLRETILQLAVSGRLISGSASLDEADSDIAEATVLKKAYRDKLDLRPMEADRVIADGDKFFSIPSRWRWVRLGNIASYIQRGKGPKYDPSGRALVVSQKCIQWCGFDITVARRISEDSLEAYGQERWLVKGDILWNSTGTGTVGRVVECPDINHPAVADSHVTIIRLPNFIPAFVRLFLSSPSIQRLIEPGVERTLVTGTTNQVELSATQVRELPIPCPSIAEQKRIVAKVDELMALCDRLEVQQQERERTFPIFSHAAHALFAEAPTQENLHRIFDENGTVVPEDIRNSIRALAIRGKLVPQDPQDGPASMFLGQISQYKARLAKESKLRGSTSVNPLSPDEGPYELPASWAWTRFGSIMVNRDGERIPVSKEEREAKAKAYDYYGASGVIDKIDDYLFDKPLLLIGEDGANLINRSTPIAFMARGKYWVNNHAHVLDGISEAFLRYIELHVNAINLEAYVTGTAQPKMNQAKMNSIPIAVPPFAEQQRILDKVDGLMAMVSQLEAWQHQRDQLAQAFAKACVASFTGTTQLTRPEIMKAPKTELVSLVTLGKKPRPDAQAPLAQLLIQAKGTLPAKSLWQQSGLEIDAFYHQLKTEAAHGWIVPQSAEMKVLEEA